MDNQRDRYDDTFPSILRALMDSHPETHERTTQKELGEKLGIRPQTVSLYKNGATQPTPETLVKMANYFNVSVDYMLTGISSENININKKYGLSENSLKRIELTNDFGATEESIEVIPLLDELLQDIDFYNFLAAVVKSEQKIKGLQESGDGDMADFQTWKLRNAAEAFILKQLQKRGLNCT